jgi:anti-sigma factor RsiW
MSATHRAGKPVLAEADLEQLSAWLDGELDPKQDRAMLDRLKRDPSLRAQFEWFNLAGDALRSHEVAACHHPKLVEQVCEALKSEPVRVGPGALSGSRVRRHIATGITVAAAAGVLSAPGKALPSRSPQLDAYFRAHRELATTGVMPSAVAYIRNSGEPDR